MMIEFKKNINLDAVMVHASMRGLFDPCILGLGMTVSEGYARAMWLKKQSDKYIRSVSDRVVEMENEPPEVE
jgi:hypothetical protein